MAHGLTIFVSAFLLFFMQLVVAKRILPWFGGAPAVWTTCMLFFQVLLLAGYAYAHFLSGRPVRRQVQIHGALVGCSLVALALLWWRWGAPIIPTDDWKPASADAPIREILKVLTVSVGLPFFLLSSTSPLIQRWFSLSAESDRTYRLYALSNVGSMLGLLGYPFLIEPWTRLSLQGQIWGALYLGFAAGCFVCATRLLKRGQEVQVNPVIEEQFKMAPKKTVVALWILLAAMTSAMLLAVTNNLCQEVAVVPFLWVLPLTIYLLSFILCFEHPRWYQRRWYVLAIAVSSVVVLITAFLGLKLGIIAHIASYSVFLFLFCMTCHGEIVRLKPAAKFLTTFYLGIAVGSAVGAVLVGLIAPNLFKGYWEFHFVLLTGWVVLALVFFRDKQSFFFTGDRLHLLVLVGVISYLAVRFLTLFGPARRIEWLSKNLVLGSLAVTVAIVLLFALATRRARFVNAPIWPRILVGAVIFFAECFMLNRIRTSGPTLVLVERNFYGVTRIEKKLVEGRPDLILLQLSHGQITHGLQFLGDEYRLQPVSYYSPGSGVGLAVRFHARRTSSSGREPMNVGVIGLGAGTMASYAEPGDTVRFYEINPAVADYSLGPDPIFTYLRDCRGKAEIVLGDARLCLERELSGAAANRFDILVMDAFSSDAVPVHLLTEEGFQVYLKHLRDEESILAINISNRFLDFTNLMAGMAKRAGMHAVLVESLGDPPDRTPSRWCLMTRSAGFLGAEPLRQAAKPLAAAQEIVWTDDYSNLFRLLK